MKQSQRCRRLAELIQRQLAAVLIRLHDDVLLAQVTITGVEVAADLSVAKIFFSVFAEQNHAAVSQRLQLESNNLRQILARELNLRITPRLIFVYDDSIARGEKIDSLLNKIFASEQETSK